MSQIKVRIVDKKTLELLEDGKKGDQILLDEIESLDLSFIDSMINNTLQARLEEIKKKTKQESYDLAKLEVTNELNEKISELNNEITSLKKDLSSQKDLLLAESMTKQQDIVNEKEKEIAELESEKKLLQQQIILLEENEENKVKTKVQELSEPLKKNIAELSKSILLKDEEIKHLKDTTDLRIDKAISEQKNKNSEAISSLENELAMLKNDRASLNIKKLGEELERWCNNEFQSYQNAGFENTTWSKDNEAVAGLDSTKTKADFIFRVYSGPELTPAEELTSVCLEMKTETLVSANHKKNSDHYAKLDSDRKKKGCFYALLVSELEWDPQNDVPLVKVREYENMYRVRPAYFISFLSLVYALSKKYKELIKERAREAIRFKDSDDILSSFDNFKNDLLDKQISHIEKRANEILKQSDNIDKANNKLKEEARKIVDTDLQQLKNKIQKFSINQVVKKIEKLEDSSDEGE